MDAWASLGTDRFELRGRLGSGAFGDVFRVYDHQLRAAVALKTLHRMDPAALYHFKKEFRGLADVHHPNLVELYELLSVDDRWFFTMELVEGCDFLEHAGLSHPDDETVDLAASAKVPDDHKLRRLRSDLEQLARGLAALHRAGKLHCDVKPSNLRVSPNERLVLLDFGLLRETPGTHVLQSGAGEMAGTPAYMAPEQVDGTVSEASDWYAVGSVLFEALTGRRPFLGGLVEILAAKSRCAPPPPSELNPAVPEDLDRLCQRLLEPDPERRPAGDEILEILGGTSSGKAAGLAPAPSQASGPFVGRDRELAALFRLLERSGRGKAVAAFLHGDSGLGKTALIDRFVEQLRRLRPEAVVLTGRCYERESVPYKGLDPLIDTLSRYLKSLPRDAAGVLVPGNVLALARLFPVLERVPAVAAASREVLGLLDDRELRRQARAALGAILRRLAERGPVVLRIDDLHWGDRDSTDLLARLLFSSGPPPVLLVGSYRRDLVHDAGVLDPLLGSSLRGAAAEVAEIAVGKLSFAETCELGRRLFAGRTAEIRNLVRTLARESGGSPYFMAELVRYSQSEPASGEESSTSVAGLRFAAPGMISLENLIWNRLEKLPAAARALLDVVAVAGQPVDLEAALDAAELAGADEAVAMQLQAVGLARLRGVDRRTIEVYHDRIRETAVQGLDPGSLGRLHRRLADALEAAGVADVETLASHYQAAGDRPRAAALAVAAAERATEAVALDRAARLYRLAVDLQDAGSDERRRLLAVAGDALAKAGRNSEAAGVYAEAAGQAAGTGALELHRRAAVQQLLGGDARAFDTIRRLLAATGIRLPRSVPGVLASLWWRRLRLKLRGLRFEERPEEEVPAEQRFRVDACWSGAGAAIEPLRWLELGSRQLLLALDAGEPRRIVRALLQETFVSAMGGRRKRRYTDRLVQLAMRLAKRLDDPYALGLAHEAAGVGAYFEGRWTRAGENFDRTEALLRRSLVDWELAWVAVWRMESHWWRGDLRELVERLPAVLDEVADRGNLLVETLLRARMSWLVRLVDDRPEEALDELERALGSFPREHFLLRFFHATAVAEMALYRGDGPAAWSAIEDGWQEVQRSHQLRVPLGRVVAMQLRCRCALAALAAEPTAAVRRRLPGTIRRDLRVIAAQRLGWSDALADLVRAGVASLHGEAEAALERLTAAEVGFEAADMELYAAVSHRRRGQLTTAGGEDLVAEADRWMAERGIRDPGRMADALAPGSWTRGLQIRGSRTP